MEHNSSAMHHVFLILAHTNPKQLLRLVDRLKHSDSQIVVHIDKRSDIEQFKESASGAHFVADRIGCIWGNWGIVQATLNSLKFIRDRFPLANRVTLISGQDYPIKPIEFIMGFFRANPQKTFIQCSEIPSKNWPGGGMGRFPHFNQVKTMITLYGGSQWWSFPMKVVNKVLSLLEENPDFVEYFKTVQIPDESFFHSLLFNSEDSEIIDSIVSNNLRCLSWEPPYFHPKLYLSRDLNDLLKSRQLFARKFDENVAPEILDLIDKEIIDVKVNRLSRRAAHLSKSSRKVCMLWFLTDVSFLPKFFKLKAEIPTDITLYLVYNEAMLSLPGSVLNENAINIDSGLINQIMFKGFQNNQGHYHNYHYILSFFLKFKDFDYYWFIEDRVHFNGNWSIFFESFKAGSINTDFLSSFIRSHFEDPNWSGWSSFRHLQVTQDISTSILAASFNPLFRISKEALTYLYWQIKNGWTGDDQVFIPTIMSIGGFSMLDFGGQGSYCLPEYVNRFYNTNTYRNLRENINDVRKQQQDAGPQKLDEKILYYPSTHPVN
ncbi:beta-1,6-N-acetylglucosaminyltransferase [Niabella sp.]|uniref:beta-1,6-N-acetylglucosaminyltransferase n=1 Tax=Niabella sp. TaxID=1962976 RepID=UPI00260C26DC|nr:beta-1,6-N-acetylglucosaminyltransferase [Niabella sp.]